MLDYVSKIDVKQRPINRGLKSERHTVRPSAHWVRTTWIDKVSPSPLPHLITDPSLAHRGIHATAHTESMRFVRHSCRFILSAMKLVILAVDRLFIYKFIFHSILPFPNTTFAQTFVEGWANTVERFTKQASFSFDSFVCRIQNCV